MYMHISFFASIFNKKAQKKSSCTSLPRSTEQDMSDPNEYPRDPPPPPPLPTLSSKSNPLFPSLLFPILLLGVPPVRVFLFSLLPYPLPISLSLYCLFLILYFFPPLPLFSFLPFPFFHSLPLFIPSHFPPPSPLCPPATPSSLSLLSLSPSPSSTFSPHATVQSLALSPPSEASRDPGQREVTVMPLRIMSD